MTMPSPEREALLSVVEWFGSEYGPLWQLWEDGEIGLWDEDENQCDWETLLRVLQTTELAVCNCESHDFLKSLHHENKTVSVYRECLSALTEGEKDNDD